MIKKLLIFSGLWITIQTVWAVTPPRSGEEVFNSSCKTCHGTNFPGAPQAHDVAAWQKKVGVSQSQAKQKNPNLNGQALDELTMSIMVSKVRNGNHAMPAKGLCNDCTDQEYQNAIKFMMQPKKSV